MKKKLKNRNPVAKAVKRLRPKVVASKKIYKRPVVLVDD